MYNLTKLYFLYSLGIVTFNKCWITLSVLTCYSPNFQGFILMKNLLNNQVGMLGDMFLWLVANLKQGVIYLIKQEGGNHKIAWVYRYIFFVRGEYIFLLLFGPLNDPFSPKDDFLFESSKYIWSLWLPILWHRS